MGKLIVLRGLPASGKSTLARKLQTENPKNTIIVSRDAIRHARGVYWIPEQEKWVSQVEYDMVQSGLDLGYDVILDATNINPSACARWKCIADDSDAGYEEIKVKCNVDECIRRDCNSDREHKVGEDVIRRFADKYKDELESWD